ncbi:MAG: flagellar export chaperone FliS [Hydrogenophaga sp.]|nr:flagellar export chaperone FliS [Hydrogenophaga sp.]
MFTSASLRAASAYKRIAAETSVQGADPHSLVGLLYDALLQSIALGGNAMARGDVATKGAALGKAVRILDEGLKAGLNLNEGGELAANLHQLYTYSAMRLTQANLRNDAKALEEVVQLIEPLAESWKLIRGPGPAYLQPVGGRGA